MGSISLFNYTPSIRGVLTIILSALFFVRCTAAEEIFDINDSRSTKSQSALGNSSWARCQHAYGKLTSKEISRFVDASGKLGSGIYGGNTLWYGSYSECQKLPDSRYCSTMFLGNILQLERNSKVYHIEWGVCIPDECSSMDLSNNFEFLLKNVSGLDRVVPLTKPLQVKCAKDPEYTASVVITIVLCGLLILTCFVATIMEVWCEPVKMEIVENGGYISMDEDCKENTPLLPDVTTTGKRGEGLCHEMLHSFSIFRNVKSIMKTDVEKSDMTYLHGIRVLTLFWIILLHANGFLFVDNLNDVIHSHRKLSYLVVNTAYGVDTFFVLSGLLMMYTNMSKKVKNNGQTKWFKYYFHRFWRLTPVYMFCILFIAKLRPFFGAGPMWFAAADTSACSEHWWTNLLYLNNFLTYGDRMDGMCMPHTWYLAADMQMFLVSPIFLVIAYRYKIRPLVCISSVTILASIIVTACLAANDDVLPAGIPAPRLYKEEHQEEIFNADRFYDGQKHIYIKPYCRIQPYIMGIVLGYLLYTHFSKELKLNWKFVAMMWTVAIALGLTDVFAPYSSIKEDPRVWTTGESALFWSLKWSIWGLCIVWLIVACHYNYAGLVKDILAAKFWIPLSRINYAAFLIHMDVLTVLFQNVETPVHYTAFTLVTHFLSGLVLTYSISFVIAVLVEYPLANLEVLGWKKWEKK